MKIYDTPKEALDAAKKNGPGGYYYKDNVSYEDDKPWFVIIACFIIVGAIVWMLPVEGLIAWLTQ